MEAIREIVEIKSHKLQFTLPENFKEKKVEMILLPVSATTVRKKKIKFNAVKLKTEGFKFDRNELHER